MNPVTSPEFSQLAQGLRWVSHTTDSKEEITVNYHKANAKQQIDSGVAHPGTLQTSAAAEGVTPVSGKIAEDARYARFEVL